MFAKTTGVDEVSALWSPKAYGLSAEADATLLLRRHVFIQKTRIALAKIATENGGSQSQTGRVPPGRSGAGWRGEGQGPYHHRKTTVIHSRQTNCEEIKPFCTFGEGGRGEGEPPTDAAMIGEDVQGEPLENLRLFWYPSKTRRRNKLHSFYLAAAVWAKPPTIRSLRRITT